MDNKQQALELGTKPVGRLLAQYALPAIIAMVASSLYNMVDSIFIGQGVGALALSGLGITFPFMNLSAAFGAGVGVGAASVLSVRLGQKDYKVAGLTLGNDITLNVITGVIFAAVCLALLNPILRFFGASDATLPYARDYMVIILLGNVITHLYFGLNAMLRAAGKPRHAMYATIFTVALNAVLDPIFIWPLGMGIRGAALATILSQAVALMWQLRLFSDRRELLHLQRAALWLDKRLVKNILSIGISPFAMNACACLVVIFINNALTRYGGDMAVGAFSISNRLAFVFIMVVMGINQGMQPIAGYNYGAGHTDRLLRVLKYATIAATAVTCTGFAIGELAPYWCVRLFTDDTTLIALAETAIRTSFLAFPLIGCQIVVTNFFQSIGMASRSIFLSLSRQLLFLLPLILVLPRFFAIDGVWYALPASDTVAALVAFYMMTSYMRQLKVKS